MGVVYFIKSKLFSKNIRWYTSRFTFCINIFNSLMVMLLVLLLSACGGKSGSSNDTATIEDNIKDEKVKVSVSVNTQDLNLNFDENQYTLIAGDESVEFSSGITTKALNLEPKEVEIISLVKENGNPILMSYDNTNDNEVDLSVESSADVFVLRSPRFYGVKITDMKELSKRIRAHKDYPSVVKVIKRQIEIDSPCPMDGACNTFASYMSEKIAQDLEFNDLIKK